MKKHVGIARPNTRTDYDIYRDKLLDGLIDDTDYHAPFNEQATDMFNVNSRNEYMNDKAIEQEIQDKGLNAPSLTPELIASKISDTQYHVFPGTCLTVCCMTLVNGFAVTGESACISPGNFDIEKGQKIAFEQAKRKIWMLEGYLLKQSLNVK